MNEIWKKNREKLLARMEMFSAAVLFAGKAPIKRGDENYPFSPDRNFYYVTGIEREDCILFLAKTRTGVEETLYIPRDNGVMAKWVGANMTAEEATAVSGIENIGWIDAFEEDFATYLFRSGIKKIWLDMENREWHGERTPALRFAEKVHCHAPQMVIGDLYPLFSDMRLIKEEWELERMRKAMDITRLGIEAMMRTAKPNQKEYEIEAAYDYTLMVKGAREKAWQDMLRLLKRLELGLLTVALDSPLKTVDVVLTPADSMIRKNKRKKERLQAELEGRQLDANIGGMTRRKIITAYRERVIRLACILEREGEISLAELRARGLEELAALLSRNYEKWFVRVEKGVYALSEKGKTELKRADYAKVAAYYRQEQLGRNEETI